jgi:hypothetical protein
MCGRRALTHPEGMHIDGRRFVVHALLVLALLGVLASTAWVTFWAGFTLDVEGPGPVAVRQEALSFGIGSCLLVLTAGAHRLLGTNRWLVAVDLVLAGLLGLVAVWCVATPGHGTDYVDGNPWTWVIWMWAVTPTTWPAFAVLATALVVRGRSRLGRR